MKRHRLNILNKKKTETAVIMTLSFIYVSCFFFWFLTIVNDRKVKAGNNTQSARIPPVVLIPHILQAQKFPRKGDKANPNILCDVNGADQPKSESRSGRVKCDTLTLVSSPRQSKTWHLQVQQAYSTGKQRFSLRISGYQPFADCFALPARHYSQQVHTLISSTTTLVSGVHKLIRPHR